MIAFTALDGGGVGPGRGVFTDCGRGEIGRWVFSTPAGVRGGGFSSSTCCFGFGFGLGLGFGFGFGACSIVLFCNSCCAKFAIDCTSESGDLLLRDGALFLTGSTSSSCRFCSNNDTKDVVGGIDAVSRTSTSDCFFLSPNPTELAATLAASRLCPLLWVAAPLLRSNCGIWPLVGETDRLAAKVAAISDGDGDANGVCLPPSVPDLPDGGVSSVSLLRPALAGCSSLSLCATCPL